MTVAPRPPVFERVIVPLGHGLCHDERHLQRGNALPQRLTIVFLCLSDGASRYFSYKEIGSEARSSDLCGLRMRDVRKGTEVVMSHIDALGDLE